MQSDKIKHLFYPDSYFEDVINAITSIVIYVSFFLMPLNVSR